jgi:hypothetical protein
MNTVARVTIIGGALFVFLGGGAAMHVYWSPFGSNVNVAKAQVVPFSHRHHVSSMGIDCRYCHTTVETGPFAGIPPTETCMTCHSQIWTEAPMLAPVRESWDTGTPLEWNRVNDLPDFAYFNHSIHVNRGVGCVTCHGQVDDMPLMMKAQTLHMKWCLGCHKAPEKFIRPRDKVFDMRWTPESEGKTQAEIGPQLVAEYGIHKEQLTNCSVCHR